MNKNIEIHPCFNKDFVGKTSRIHLPLVKNCNIQCNYCNKNYSCPNENRPGVTNQIIKPEDVYFLIKKSLILYPDLRIIGFAGPGESLAEPDILYDSFKVIRKHFPDLKLCLSTNGLAVIDSINLIKDFKIDYITVTINTLNPDTASKIYQTNSINELISKQTEGIKELSKLKITTKINTVVIPEVNIKDINNVAMFAQKMNIYAQNLIPFIPVKGSVFENFREPTKEELIKLRFDCSKYIKQIAHCKRCRSDVVGNLANDGKITVNK